jgi:hypothetical protein
LKIDDRETFFKKEALQIRRDFAVSDKRWSLAQLKSPRTNRKPILHGTYGGGKSVLSVGCWIAE